MTVPDRTVPSIPCVSDGLSVRVGGLTISAMPRLGMPTFSANDAITSIMQQLGPALAPMKMAGDIVSAITTLIKFATAVPAAVKEGDPEILVDAIKAVKEISTKLAPYIPGVAYVATVYDALRLVKAALGSLSTTLQNISTEFDKAAAVLQQAQDEANSSLESTAAELQARAQAQLDCAGATLAAIMGPLQIVSQLAEMIPSPPSLPEMPDVTGMTISQLIEAVDALYEALEAIV